MPTCPAGAVSHAPGWREVLDEDPVEVQPRVPEVILAQFLVDHHFQSVGPGVLDQSIDLDGQVLEHDVHEILVAGGADSGYSAPGLREPLQHHVPAVEGLGGGFCRWVGQAGCRQVRVLLQDVAHPRPAAL